MGKKLLVRRDHTALKFLCNYADNSCLMCLSLHLSEFDFEIAHVLGSKIMHMNALSRHVGLVEETQLMSEEIMIREQKEDSFCKQQIQN